MYTKEKLISLISRTGMLNFLHYLNLERVPTYSELILILESKTIDELEDLYIRILYDFSKGGIV